VKKVFNTLRMLIAFFMAAVVIVLGVLFSLQNQSLISVDLLLPAPIEQTVAFWLLASFSVGVVVSLVVFSLMYLRTKKRSVQLSLKVKSLQRQLDNQKTDS